MTNPLSQEGVAIQSMSDLKKLPPEALIEKFQQAARALDEEKRHSARKEQDAAVRLRMECDRLRTTTAQHIREIEEQNTTLLKSMTRLQIENDKLKHEITTLQVKLEMASSNNHPRHEPAMPLPLRHYPEGEPLSSASHPGAPLAIAAPAPVLSGDMIPPKLPPVPQAAPVQAQALPQ